MRRDAVRKQIRPRSLPQKIDNLFAATGETAARTAERFAERASNDVDLAHHAAVFVGAASAFTEKASRMRVIDHGERVVFCARSTIAPRFAIVPSIEKQPSVAIKRKRAFCAARNCASRSAMSLC